MEFESILRTATAELIAELYGAPVNEKAIQIQKTRKEFQGDFSKISHSFKEGFLKGTALSCENP